MILYLQILGLIIATAVVLAVLVMLSVSVYQAITGKETHTHDSEGVGGQTKD